MVDWPDSCFLSPGLVIQNYVPWFRKNPYTPNIMQTYVNHQKSLSTLSWFPMLFFTSMNSPSNCLFWLISGILGQILQANVLGAQPQPTAHPCQDQPAGRPVLVVSDTRVVVDEPLTIWGLACDSASVSHDQPLGRWRFQYEGSAMELPATDMDARQIVWTEPGTFQVSAQFRLNDTDWSEAASVRIQVVDSLPESVHPEPDHPIQVTHDSPQPTKMYADTAPIRTKPLRLEYAQPDTVFQIPDSLTEGRVYTARVLLGWTILPRYAQQQLVIQGLPRISTPLHIQIMEGDGKKVWWEQRIEQVDPGRKTIRLEVGDLPAGAYRLFIQSDDTHYGQRFEWKP